MIKSRMVLNMSVGLCASSCAASMGNFDMVVI